MRTSISWTIATRRWIGTSLGLHWGGFMEKPSVKLLDPQYLDPTEGGSALFSVVRPTHVVADISLKVLKHILVIVANISTYLPSTFSNITILHLPILYWPQYLPKKIETKSSTSLCHQDFHGFSWIFMDFPLFSISPTPKVFQTSPVQAPSLRNPLRSPPVHSDIPRSSRMSSNASATPRKRTPPSRPWNPRRAAAMATRSLRRPWPRPIRASSPRWENFEMRGWRPWKPWGNQGEIKYINMEGELKHSKFFRWSSLIMMIRCLWQCFFQFTFLYYGTCGYRHL